METRTLGNEALDNAIGRVRISVRQIDSHGKFVEGASTYQVTIPAAAYTTVVKLIQDRVLPKVMNVKGGR